MCVDGGQWDQRSYQDKYYKMRRFTKADYRTMSEDPPEAALAAIALEMTKYRNIKPVKLEWNG